LKARAGDKEPGVTGQVLDSLLGIEHEAAIPFVAGFLESPEEDTREEAALALGASRLPGVIEVLKEAWTSARNIRSGEPLLRAISASRQESGLDFLLQLIRDGRPADARDAVSALRFHRESPEIAGRVREAAEARGDPILEFFRDRFTA
jgi:HEAT repeat protein